MKGNTLPMLTWRWLDVNDVDTGLAQTQLTPFRGVDSFGERDEAIDALIQNNTGISEETMASNRSLNNFFMGHILDHATLEDVRLVLDQKDDFLADRTHIRVPEGKAGRILIDISSADDSAGERNGVIGIEVEKNACVQLFLTQRLNQNTINNLSIVARLQENAQLHIAQVEFGAKRSLFHYTALLEGDRSKTTVNAAYMGDNDQVIDLFYDIKHIGKHTNSDLLINGALQDKARKSFRGTIDFKVGSSGSVGSEEEFALLLSEDVRSIAVPLLLCHEDDVQGNHAASAGRIDETMLFYIMSRGFTREEAVNLIVEAKMTPVFDRIPDEALKDVVKSSLHERIVAK